MVVTAEGGTYLQPGQETPTEPKAAFAGVMLEVSFARFSTSMARFNIERTLSRSLGCCEEAVWNAARKE